MYIALLGRQPELSMAELERVYHNVEWFSAETALFRPTTNTSATLDVQRLGGSQKLGELSQQLSTTDWHHVSKEVITHHTREWRNFSGKLTLGISAYGFSPSAVSARDVQKVGIMLKSSLKKYGVSVRLIPNNDAALSTATSHHNKLGLAPNKVELLIVRGKSTTIVAKSLGAQNITALAARDQGRPRRDAFVGMLPPKLAQMMINMAVGDVLQGPQLQEQGRGQGWSRDESQDHSQSQPPRPRLLDPFCGTGVLLQEALLLGCSVYGTDLSDKMIRYTHDNLTWLHDTFHLTNTSDASQNRASGTADFLLAEGDAMTYQWQKPLDAIVSEAYLGQPFSAPPSPEKLAQVQKNCQHIITAFLSNISQQISIGTPVVLAVPAWRTANGDYSHLPLTQTIEKYGFKRLPLTTVDSRRLMYARPEQVVARELLLVEKT